MTLCHKRKVSFLFPKVSLFGFAIRKFTNGSKLEDDNQECMIEVNKLSKRVSQYLAITKKLGNEKCSDGLHNFESSNGTNLVVLLIFTGD